MLEQYNRVLPDGANRIVAMAESQLQHRQSLEGAVVRGNLRAEIRGQVFGFILGLAAIGGGISLIAHDKDVQGLVAILSAFAALAGVFVYSRRQQAKEREQKRKELLAAEAQQRLPLEPEPD